MSLPDRVVESKEDVPEPAKLNVVAVEDVTEAGVPAEGAEKAPEPDQVCFFPNIIYRELFHIVILQRKKTLLNTVGHNFFAKNKQTNKLFLSCF